eukprot:TRINITY_DN6577_c0_g2_i2.p1 TRINITY_DN6577_c0_g2~~TRINITY_DN6577_c0_g2_i2.p1  ORF type:complete len:411 (+),score=58.94 TRINITY_DN6577_c0_g2_i2:61-1293(+)
MGICGVKAKKENTAIQQNRGDRNARPDQSMTCPKCQQIFPPTTSSLNFNTHVQGCSGLSNLPNSTQENLQIRSASRTNLAPSLSGKRTEEEKPASQDLFYWKKIDDTHGENAWQKVPQSSTLKNIPKKISLEDVRNLNYHDKLRWFRSQIDKLRIPWTQGSDKLTISKDHILFESILKLKSCLLHKELKIEFEGELLNDAGGLLREWINLNIRELFKPETGIFRKSDADEITYSFKPFVSDEEFEMDKVRHAAKVIGKAIFERIPINAYLDKTIIKHILGHIITLDDIDSIDKPVAQSLRYILDHDIEQDAMIEEYFVITHYQDKTEKVVELKEGGSSILLTNENKREYVELKVQWIGYLSVKSQVDAFLEELGTVIPLKNFSVFDTRELEMIINGVPFIDVDDLSLIHI